MASSKARPVPERRFVNGCAPSFKLVSLGLRNQSSRGICVWCSLINGTNHGACFLSTAQSISYSTHHYPGRKNKDEHTSNMLVWARLTPFEQLRNIIFCIQVSNASDFLVLFFGKVWCKLVEVTVIGQSLLQNSIHSPYRSRCTRQSRMMNGGISFALVTWDTLAGNLFGGKDWMRWRRSSPQALIWGLLPSTKMVEIPDPWRNLNFTGRPVTRSASSQRDFHTMWKASRVSLVIIILATHVPIMYSLEQLKND